MTQRHSWQRLGAACVCASVLLGLGCQSSEPAASCPCPPPRVGVSNADAVDLLFMVDNSNSMGEEQASLIAEFATLVEALTSGELVRADGSAQAVSPVMSLRVGVVSSDMGTGGFLVRGPQLRLSARTGRL